jgi:ubiquinone/menaquinone biosynthesis C-methylase UbiE
MTASKDPLQQKRGHDDLIDYYAQRAHEGERFREKPERQEDLRFIRGLIKHFFRNHHVLEVACGTGYWTEVISTVALSVLAIDVNEGVLELAKRRSYPKNRVSFQVANAYCLEHIGRKFTAAFVGFWWSHIPRSKLHSFLQGLHSCLTSGSQVLMIDNLFIKGNSYPISHRDVEGNTYQDRALADGTVHRVLKNFYDGKEIVAVVESCATNVEFTKLSYYWYLSFQTPPIEKLSVER